MAAWSESQAADILSRHEGRPGALLPILHDVQAAFGHVPTEAVPVIAAALNLSRAEACQSMKGPAIAEQMLRRFDLDWRGTTPEGRLTVEATYCLGLRAVSDARW